MTQFIVTIEDNSQPSLIKELISLIRGVKSVDRVQKSSEVDFINDPDLADVPKDIRSLIGIAANINEKDIAEDDRLAYILSK